MKQIEIFPFSRDGYHYDVQPGFSPVFELEEHDLDGQTVFLATAPEEMRRLIVVGDTVAECEAKMQDFVHAAYTSLEQVDLLNCLNEAGDKTLIFYQDNLIITNP